MKRTAFLLQLLFSAVAHGQEVIVATERGLMVSAEEQSHPILAYEEPTAVSGHRVVPLAADSINHRVFYSLPQETEAGEISTRLMFVNMRKGASPEPQPVALLSSGRDAGHIRGLAYDERRGILYWTNMIHHSIGRCTVTDGCEDVTLLKKLPETKEPAAIALDPCRRYLFWTDNNHTSPSVNRMSLKEKKSVAIVQRDLFMPNGIAIDTSGKGRIYWTDDSVGSSYKIESADLDGRNRERVHQGYYQMPMDLSFLPPIPGKPKGALYWSDWVSNSVWTLDLNDTEKGARQLAFRGGHWDRPMGVLPLDSLLRNNPCDD